MRLVLIAVLAVAASSAAAQTPPAVVSAPLQMRASQAVELFNGERALKDYFIAGINQERFSAKIASVRAEFGKALNVSAVEATTPNCVAATVEYERGQRRMKICVTEAAPHLVNDFGAVR